MTGSGTLADPFVIWDVFDLQAMEDDLSAYYELANDIDASATVGWNGGLGFEPVGRWPAPAVEFSGYFDGKGYTITGLTINRPLEEYCGLFGCTAVCGNDRWIKNVTLSNVDITGESGVGALVGCHEVGAHTISNCHVTGNIAGKQIVIGGLLGYNGSPVQDCHSECSVTVISLGEDVESVGGFVGRDSSNGVTRCFATGEVVINGSAGRDVRSIGGFAGEILNELISKCYSTGNVVVDNAVGDDADRIGGFIGQNGGIHGLSDCYARGNVTLTPGSGTSGWVGGFVGVNTLALITKCYSTGLITVPGEVSFIGGFCGQNTDVITNSFWDIETSGQAASDGGTGKTTAEMKSASTFIDAGWGFGTIWGMTGACNDGYPCLLGVTPSCAWAPVAARKGNIVIDQLIYQHAERMRG